MKLERYDAVIVGARCAGAATAMLMARRGLRVLAVDAAKSGTDTISSHALTRGAVMQLDRWGLLDRVFQAGTPNIPRTTFHYGEDIFSIEFPADRLPGVIGPRRYLLDRILAEAAAEAGAQIRFRTAFKDVLTDSQGRVTGAVLQDAQGRTTTVATDLLVGADGVRSRVARRTGGSLRRQEPHALGHVYGYFTDIDDPANHGYFAGGTSVGVVPTNGGAHCVIVSAHPDRLRVEIRAHGPAGALTRLAMETDPVFADTLRTARLTEPPVVFAGTPGFVRDCAGPGWALAGDAGLFRDPVTSHGITDAFRDAEMLADAALCGTEAALTDYQATRDAVTRDVYEITSRIARFDLPLARLKAEFHNLSQAMRAEQDWMEDAFADRVLAA